MDRLLKPQTVRLRRQQAYMQMTDKIKAATDAFHDEMKTLRARCGHDWRYYPDASGGSDSFWECDVCGLEQGQPPDVSAQ